MAATNNPIWAATEIRAPGLDRENLNFADSLFLLLGHKSDFFIAGAGDE
jgi:hypothetical protein